MQIDFITVEDRLNQVVSFAIAPGAHRSLTLVRSVQFESVAPEHEPGIRLCFEPKEEEREMLRVVLWRGTDITLTTTKNQYVLDITGVLEEEVFLAKVVLRKMVEGGPATFEDA